MGMFEFLKNSWIGIFEEILKYYLQDRISKECGEQYQIVFR